MAIILDGGQPELLVYTCAGADPVVTVQITKHDVHSATEEVLWQVRRTSSDRPASETVDRIRLSDPPAGYRSVTALGGPLPDGSLDASVNRTRPRGVFTFKAHDLRTTALRVEPSWYGRHRFVDESEFLSVNRKNC